MFDIASIFSALGNVSKLFIPYIENSVQQRFEDEFKGRLADYQQIVSVPNSDDRARAIGAFTNKLCVDAGSPPGIVSGQSIEVPLEYYQSLITIAAGKIRDDEMLARISFKPI